MSGWQGTGPGAVVWPGYSVVWVRDGGDEGLSCVDATTGQVLQRWDAVQGPVATIGGGGLALAIDPPGTRLLPLTACPG